MSAHQPRKHKTEFKEALCQKITFSSYTVAEASREHNIHANTIHGWLKAFRASQQSRSVPSEYTRYRSQHETFGRYESEQKKMKKELSSIKNEASTQEQAIAELQRMVAELRQELKDVKKHSQRAERSMAEQTKEMKEAAKQIEHGNAMIKAHQIFLEMQSQESEKKKSSSGKAGSLRLVPSVRIKNGD